MKENDHIRLQHILDASLKVHDFVEGVTSKSLESNKMLLRALCMSIGIIGEAANNISQEFRDSHPQVPWRSAIAMRNFLFHEYFKIDPGILWDTATVNVPKVQAEVEKLLESSVSDLDDTE